MKTLDDYLRIGYPVVIQNCEEGGFFAKIPTLPGCITQGETVPEVWKNIQECRIGWLKTAFEQGDPIPELPENDVPASEPSMRAETGPMKFKDDWTGIFIRGDTALFYSQTLSALTEYQNKPVLTPLVKGLADLLASAHEANKEVIRQPMKPFLDCCQP